MKRIFTTRTLTRHLLGWVLVAFLLVWTSFIAVGYAAGEHEADELTDGHLASVAALLLALHGELSEREPLRPRVVHDSLKAHDYQQSLSVAVWDANGRLLARLGDAATPGFDTPEGFATLKLGAPAAPWRTFSRWDEGHLRKVTVLLSLAERDELAQDIAGQIIEPALWVLPVIALVLGLAIMRGLRPLYALSRDVRSMDIHHAKPLETPAPHEELREIAAAINTLVGRYNGALIRERALANEFAHELRTPLASLRLQARALRDLPEGPERVRSQARLEQDAQRAADVISHLLALARADRVAFQEAAEPVELHALAAQVVAQLAPEAEAAGRQLALKGETLALHGHPVLLELALRNLIENALSHTPPGTLVEVHVDAAGHCLEVRDEPPAERAEDSARPTPALRLKLGHKVVQKVAEIHGASFQALPGAAGGSCYRLVFG
ncbi:sensor histidine kinase [Ramlibacter solisilvae]|uniref:histidine kinase n=1 Tax=Ramlibacter tataouinensis TaxID=94132 RepID=A0A127JYA7_9BURK|nr:histidine kinase dimerization/phospho-acceptor domain-containing protein [Ramlibacter tataouinensis]AMO24978.1 hypothetical protein UC35_21800 [Ramlibacter tataouinensis]